MSCACRKSSSDVLMVKSTEKWPGSNTARGMDGTRQRSILAEAIGASGPGCNRPHKTAADGEDDAPRTRRHGPSNRVGSNRSPFHNIHSATATAARLADLPNAHRAKAADEDLGVDRVAVTNNVSRRHFPTVSLGELVRNPFGRRARSHSQRLPAARANRT